MTPTEAEEVEQGQDDRTACGDWVECPHCSGKILVSFKSKVWIQKAETPSEHALPPNQKKKKDWRDGLSQQQVSILDHATRTGLFASFVAAMERGPHNGLPRNQEKYFLDWLKMCKPKIVPGWAISEFKSLYPKTFVEFYGYNFVGAVIADGEIMLFMPIDLVAGIKVKTSMNGEKRMAPPDASGVRQWIKTRMGYVPQEARIALAETKKRSIGEYANPVL